MITCYFEDGKKVFLRHIVVDIMVVDRKKILLEKRAAHLVEGRKYALIGGYVEQGENIRQTVLRETLEETGYEIVIDKLFKINDNPRRKNDPRQNIALIFLAKPIKKVAEADKESQEVKWFDLNNLPKEEDFAFDHFEQIQLYLSYLKKPFPLPVLK